MIPLKILLVDDDDMSRELLQLLLTRHGYRVATAISGDDALIQLKSGTKADVVLTDLQMPGLTGPELAQELRACSGAPRVILAMSGSHPPEDRLTGFDGFLLKPFTMETLAAAIEAGSGSAARSISTESASPNHAILDLGTYSKLKASMKPEKLEQLYELCLNDIARRVAAMRISGANGDDEAYRREAHAIKGGCGMVGALELQSIAASEEIGGIDANHVATLDEILAAAERLKRMLVAQRNHT